MAKTYDVPLRKLFKDVPVNFLKLVFGKEFKADEVKFLDVKLSKLFEREADLVFEHRGEIYHLEIQSTDDPKMALRMLHYYGLIVENYQKAPIQAVVYVGEKPLRQMVGKLTLPNLEFSYRVVDLNGVDCQRLLESKDPSDWILSVLCRIENEERTLSELLRKLLNLPEGKRQKALSMLLHLAKLRPKRLNFLKKEVEKMPITIDLEKDPFYLQAKREDAINLYKATKWPIEKIAQIVNVSPKKVKKWLKEEGLLKEEKD